MQKNPHTWLQLYDNEMNLALALADKVHKLNRRWRLNHVLLQIGDFDFQERLSMWENLSIGPLFCLPSALPERISESADFLSSVDQPTAVTDKIQYGSIAFRRLIADTGASSSKSSICGLNWPSTSTSNSNPGVGGNTSATRFVFGSTTARRT